jgi:hypothetical protein
MEKYLAALALVEDPLGRSAENKMRLGVISGVESSTGTVRISFGDLSISSYGLDRVMVLKDRNVLYEQLLTAAGEIDIEIFKVLLRVNMLQDRGSSTAILEAMQLLMKSPEAMRFALSSLSDQLGLSSVRSTLERGKR